MSGILTAVPASPTARILDGMLVGRFRFLLSVELLAEYREVLLGPKIRRRHRLSEVEVDTLLTDIAANGVALDLWPSSTAGRRRGDGHLWQIFAAVPSALLVTGDQRLIDKPSEGSQVLTAGAFAERLGD